MIKINGKGHYSDSNKIEFCGENMIGQHMKKCLDKQKRLLAEL